MQRLRKFDDTFWHKRLPFSQKQLPDIDLIHTLTSNLNFALRMKFEL